MTFWHWVCALILGCLLYCFCQSLPSIWSFIKTPFVVKNINHISTVSFYELQTTLNKFLNEEFQITYDDKSNVTFILENFDNSVKRMFFNYARHDLRQAIVSKETFFYLALYNFLLGYNEVQDMNEKPLCVKTNQNEYSITPLGITFYKMLAANSKKCDGKKGIYKVCARNEFGASTGKPYYPRYTSKYIYEEAFEKLKTKSFHC